MIPISIQARRVGAGMALALVVVASRTSDGSPEAPGVVTGPQAPGVGGEPVAEESRNIIVVEQWVLPEPDEFFAAVEKKCQPDWFHARRKMLPTNFTDRAQIALNMGGLLADAHIAIETRDVQRVSNLSQDMRQLADSLGVGEDAAGRATELIDLAEASQWEKLRLALNLLAKEITASLGRQNDHDLAALIEVGGYLRGLEVLAAMVHENYDENAAKLLRQPHLARHLASRIPAGTDTTEPNPLEKQISQGLRAITDLMGTSPGHIPDREAIGHIHEIAARLNADIIERTAL